MINVSSKEALIAKIALNNIAVLYLRRAKGIFTYPDDLLEIIEMQKKALDNNSFQAEGK